MMSSSTWAKARGPAAPGTAMSAANQFRGLGSVVVSMKYTPTGKQNTTSPPL